MYDLIIEGAAVYDGLGGGPVSADVAVSNGRIAAVGRLSEPARETVDADGLALAPGIVDVHTHYDAQLTWEPTASPSTALGVTTVVMGNCGFGIAPCPAAVRDLIARNLSEVEGMPLEALRAGIDWSFDSYADYLGMLRAKGVYPNVAGFVGHSTVRSAVMGAAASERAARDDEIAAMGTLVRRSLAEGAIGFASSQSHSHNGYGGVPMPSRLAGEDELRALVGELGHAGRGVYQMTVGPTTTVPFLESLARDTGRPVVFSALFQNDAFPERAPAMLAECAAAQARGVPVYGQVGCQPLSMDFTLANAYPLMSLDVWQALRAADRDTVRAALADPAFRARFRETLAAPVKGKLFYGNWRHVDVAKVARPENAGLEGQTIEAVAGGRGADPVDAFFDLALGEDLETVFTAALLNTDEHVVGDLLRHPASVIALSDGGAHLAFMCDAGYGLQLLGHWVRERGTFTLAEAVRQLTSLPADLYGISGRGRIAPGAHADLLLFDPRTVGRSGVRRVHDLPGGASRMVRDPVGVHGVWVNGRRIFDGADYVPHARPPGTVLDRFDAASIARTEPELSA